MNLNFSEINDEIDVLFGFKEVKKLQNYSLIMGQM